VTECPKCGTTAAPGARECAHCGVVFAKLEKRLAEEEEARNWPIPQPSMSTAAVASRDLTDEAVSGVVWWGRAAFLVVLTIWTWSFASKPMGVAVMSSFLHLPDLVFHEAGHIIFSPFGRFMTVLGGSLNQCLIPAILAVAFARERQWFAVAVMVWWVGQNFLDLAPYIADARALRLVLLGGKTGAEVEGHDWEYLLNTLRISHLDIVIGTWVHRLGLTLMIGSLGAAAYTLFRKESPQ
jgi:hypothetical protein